ncbi:MAG: hypothetical protein CVT92_00550 [Bacteroidetes bacterium HGW-Bacteroidetes-1]|jgi:M6 family metalloprotease-like protein|nr:MAG: hypothetical protein CVT92_00550 [Bacteroidetes bacterium HGW-Bacteroidetes-1]
MTHHFTLKKHISKAVFMFIMLVSPYLMQAAWLQNEPVTITQPNGDAIACFATGDEFYNWLHDKDNFTIIQSQEDGFFYFAEMIKGELRPSAYQVGVTNPKNTHLTPGINIQPEMMRQIRIKMEEELKFTEPGRTFGRADGTLNNLVIYIRFSDQEEFTSDTIVNFNKFNANTPNANSVFNYFQEISYSQLNLLSTFYPVPPDNTVLSYQDPFPRSYYMPYNAVTNPDGYQENQRTQREHALLANAVNWINLNSPVPPEIDLDYNGDGRADNVVFIIRGAPTAWSTLLWPHRWSLYSEEAYINGKRVWDFNFQLETSLLSSGVGVLCHELYHSLGAPDLYRYVNNDITPIGPWDIMAANNNPPQYMGAFMKFKYGNWIEDIPWITERGTYTLNSLQKATNNVYRIPSQNSSQEYFVVEFRKKEGTFDGTLQKSGMLIYRINPAAGNGNAQGPPDEVYVFRPGGTPSNSGNLSNAVFGENYNRSEFNDYSEPYSFLQNGSPGGVYISDITEVGETMSFTVDFPSEIEAMFSSNVKVACLEDTIRFYDTSVGMPSSWLWTFQPSNVTFQEGTNAVSKNPVVRFNQEGNYSVTMTAINEFGPMTVQLNDYIYIGSQSGFYADDFESGSFTDGSWKVVNPDHSVTWGLHSVGGNGGEMAAGINFRTYFSIGQRDRIVSMPFNFSGLNAAYLSFEHSYAQNSAFPQFSDSLNIYISADCGASWTPIAFYGENGTGNFATHLPTDEVFYPSEPDDWCGQGWGSPCNTIDLSAWAGLDDVRIAFETVSYYGNPLLIDNVVISQYVGQNEAELSDFEVQIFPNPTNGNFTIEMEGTEKMTSIRMFNPFGQVVFESLFDKSLLVEKQGNWSAGIYVLNITDGIRSYIRKVAIK